MPGHFINAWTHQTRQHVWTVQGIIDETTETNTYTRLSQRVDPWNRPPWSPGASLLSRRHDHKRSQGCNHIRHGFNNSLNR